jgi:predicted ArsR family transcriptional regulator
MNATPAVLAAERQQSHWLDVIADPVRLQILRALSQVGEATTADLALRGQASYQTLRRHLEALEAVGVIQARPGESDGETLGRPAALFRLRPDVRKSVRTVFSATP